jgi:hypothetical protein
MRRVYAALSAVLTRDARGDYRKPRYGARNIQGRKAASIALKVLQNF